MDITIHQTFLPHDDPDASLAFYRDTLGFEVRNDVEYGGMHWNTVGPPDQPGTSIVLHPPGADPGVTDDERRTIAEMMAKGTYASINLATTDLDGTFERLQAGDADVVAGADRPAVGRSRLRPPRSRGQPDPHPGAEPCRRVRSSLPLSSSDARIEELDDWRGETLASGPKADQAGRPRRGRGVEVARRTGVGARRNDLHRRDATRSTSKLTFFKGASLEDPSGLFNSSLEGNTRRAIDIHESDEIDERALKALVRAALELNESKQVKADSHDLIRVHGARVNNLKDVSVELPKRRLTVFTGVSGSGKSSLVFGTIAAESQRLINETYSAFVQGFMPTLARPEVDVLDGLTTAIIVDQERMGADPRSTVGTATDANAMLRILFSRLGKPHIGPPSAFAFNVASVSASGGITVERGDKTETKKATYSRTGGMCERCEGRGSVTDFDLSALYDDSKSINEGAITIPGYSMDGWYGRIYRGCGFFDPDKPISKYNKRELHDLLYKEPTKIKVEGINLTYSGLIPQIQKSFLSKDPDAMQPHIRAFVERAVTFTTCPECDGTRLSEAARSSKIKKINIADACAMQIDDLAEWVRGLDEPSVAPLLAGAAAHARLVRGDRAGLPLARAVVGHALGRRGAAHEDDPPPRVVAHRRDLRLRRADHRPAPARRRADERPAAAAARQGQHGARRRARAGDDRDRRPRRRPRPRRRHGGRHDLLRGHRRGAAGQRHHHRAPSRRPRRAQGRRCGRRRRRWRSAAPTPTTCRTSTSTSRSACWSWSPASPAPARAR